MLFGTMESTLAFNLGDGVRQIRHLNSCAVATIHSLDYSNSGSRLYNSSPRFSRNCLIFRSTGSTPGDNIIAYPGRPKGLVYVSFVYGTRYTKHQHTRRSSGGLKSTATCPSRIELISQWVTLLGTVRPGHKRFMA